MLLHLYDIVVLPVSGQSDTDSRGEYNGHGTSYDWPAVCPAPGGSGHWVFHRHCALCYCMSGAYKSATCATQ
jgi:hypothetical protein